jgi:hypothetical protein
MCVVRNKENIISVEFILRKLLANNSYYSRYFYKQGVLIHIITVHVCSRFV